MGIICENRFFNKVMLITGATSGIGKVTAIRAAKEGAKVAIVGRREELGLEIVEKIKADGGEASFFKYDLTIEGAPKKLIEDIVNKYGKLDIAINNAGVMGTPAPIHKSTTDNLEYVMNTNLYSVVACCKYEILQFMAQKTGGVIINNSSVAGLTGIPGLPAYTASKHALNGLTKNLAIDYAQYNIRVNSVNPATTLTSLIEQNSKNYLEMVENAEETNVDPSTLNTLVGMKTENLLKKPATPEEQAASILYLASDDASHMTGATVATDGGWTTY